MTDASRVMDAVKSEARAIWSLIGSNLGGSFGDVWRIARKELATFFSSLAALIFIGVFLAVTLFIFFWVERFFARNIADVRPMFEWMPVLLIFLVSALTMRMWSEERRAGTLEFLMTSPVKPFHLVLGKFFGCLALVGIALLLTLPLPITVSMLGPMDWGPVIGGYVATIALAAAYISIGLFVSARTESQIVSLIVTTLICGAFYLLGSNALTTLVGTNAGELLRWFGTGSRFESITRGVIDIRDLYYYFSILGVFLVLNLYSLESLRWSKGDQGDKHFQWQAVAGLVIANLLAGNLWLGQITSARADLTEGDIYSVSDETKSYLAQLQEPLLIRGYFSGETHPLLAPLVPRLRDLLKEYEVAGGGRVRVEFVDPVNFPEIEEEANRTYNIKAVPFQTTSKYQASVTNSYFNVLVKYGDEFESLGYENLIEVNQQGVDNIEVELRNPEYDITRAVKKVLYSYRGAGGVFESLPKPVELDAYISAEQDLPKPLPKLKADLQALIKEFTDQSKGKFSGKIQDPSANGGQLSKSLQQQLGLRPLSVGLFDQKRFWFHLVLRSGTKTVQVALPEGLDKESLKRNIEAELKRFRPGALRNIALYTPPPPPPPQQQQFQRSPPDQAPKFGLLEQRLRSNAVVESVSMLDGSVPDASDILFVASPDTFTEKQVFAIDQFLMRGGTVVVAASSRMPSMQGNLSLKKHKTGLEDWFKHHGLTLEDQLVLDPQNTPFPVPVARDVGGMQVREIQLVSYSPFVDVRRDGLASGQAPTAGLNQVTLTWPSPIAVDEKVSEGRTITRLVESSAQSWVSDTIVAVPDPRQYPTVGFATTGEPGRKLLAVAVEGRFDSLFAGKPSPLAQKEPEADTDDKTEKDKKSDGEANADKSEDGKAEEKKPTITTVIEHSPESARIILLGSSSFLSDDVLDLVGSVDRTLYLSPVTFAENIVDWSLEDRGLLALRSRAGKFSRTLLPISENGRALWEYFNYALALLGLGAVYGVRRRWQSASERRHLEKLGLGEA